MSTRAPRPSRPRPTGPGRPTHTAARFVSGVLVVGLAAAAALVPDAWDAVPGAPSGRAVEPPTVTLDPTSVALGCAAGPVATMGEAAVVDPAAPPEDTAVAVQRRVVSLPRPALGTDAAPASLDGAAAAPAGALRILEDDAPADGILSAPPFQGYTAALAGATVARANGGDLRGLVATACALPQDSAWLVGGGSQVGESVQVTLQNVGATPASVDLTVLGSLGPMDAPSLTRIALAPGATSQVLLEGAVAPDPALAVRVDASGGQVAARGQWLRLDGLVAGGISALAPAATPGTSSVIPAAIGTDADPVTVRLVNPGEQPARAEIAQIADDGARTPGTQVEVPAAATLDVLVPAGTSSALSVTSDVPIAAAAGLRRTGAPSLLDPDTPPVDTAWVPATTGRTAWGWALPGVGDQVESVQLSVVAPQGAPGDAVLTVYRGPQATPEEVPLTVPAGGAAIVPVPEDAVAMTLRSDAPLAATALLSAQAPDGELVEALPATPDAHADQVLRVDVR